ncbi:hypothetical protein NB714_004264 [Pantoea dispersa]|nr:hypothetical protein [Pantoea dispersa]MCW0328139.1 hypothetical protein [Pantoea dispersa]MCW0434662.1 hypothetical protein [Pantoea dispersa]
MNRFLMMMKSIFGTGYDSEPKFDNQDGHQMHSVVNTDFISLAKKRRSVYALGKNVLISQYEIAGLIKDAVKQAPSAFNSQSSRVVILFGRDHGILWNMTREKLRKIVPPENFQSTAERISSFADSAGTVLFFEDQDTVKLLQEQYPGYAENFPVWSEQSSGMAQYAVWLALAEKGIGANLQHYNPLIDEEVHTGWNVPASWKLRAQMNFGSTVKKVEDKDYIEDSDRFIIPNRT